VPAEPVPAAAVPAASASGAAVRVAPPAGDVLAEVRARLADDLDAPGALAAVDAWADAVLAGAMLAGAGPGSGPGAAGLIRDTVDALLGIAL
jgi:L-cysteine:1D-myo-inositol 2-amino-2-deoxy-alpha-D-glucopyranoside ligase